MNPTRFLPVVLIVSVCAAADTVQPGSAAAPDAKQVAPAPAVHRERQSFDAGWRFHQGDSMDVGESLTYERIKEWVLPTGDDLLADAAGRHAAADPMPTVLGGGRGVAPYARPEFDDSGWRQLDLPHDWGIEGPFQQELQGDTGKLPWFGIAWYRKHFALPAAAPEERTYIEFDGAMAYALVWCNGRFVGGWPYGYSSWRLDLTDYVKPGADNVIAVRLDNPRESSRWYPGGGIYRNVWLLQTSPVAVAQWGIFVTTPRITPESALVDVAVTLDNLTSERVEAKVGVRMFAADADGNATGDPVATGEPVDVHLSAGRQAQISHTLTIANPRLWGLKERNRYVAETTVLRGDTIVDRTTTPFGIRTLEFTADRGLLLNGERIPINGVCDHHDLGALGSAVNTRALERQLEIRPRPNCSSFATGWGFS